MLILFGLAPLSVNKIIIIIKVPDKPLDFTWGYHKSNVRFGFSTLENPQAKCKIVNTRVSSRVDFKNRRRTTGVNKRPKVIWKNSWWKLLKRKFYFQNTKHQRRNTGKCGIRSFVSPLFYSNESETHNTRFLCAFFLHCLIRTLDFPHYRVDRSLQ